MNVQPHYGSAKIILIGLPPVVSHESIEAWAAAASPRNHHRVSSLTLGKQKSDGTIKPSQASLESQLNPSSAHQYALN